MGKTGKISTLKKEYNNLDNIVEITNNIIEPYLQQYKKDRWTERTKKTIRKATTIRSSEKGINGI